jgi:hypothetical protein
MIGKWKMTSSENFDEYMKAIGKISRSWWIISKTREMHSRLDKMS